MRRLAAWCGFMLSLVALAGTSSLRGRAQEAARSQNPPVFRAGADLIEMDVSVLDKDRRPVKGLTAADFTVLDEGQPRPVVAFSTIEVPDAATPSATWSRTTTPDVTSNQFNDHRLVVMAISDRVVSAVADNNGGLSTDVYVEPGVGAAEMMQQLARTVIDQLGPADLASVVYLYHRELGQDFTADAAKLGQALDRFQPVVEEIGAGAAGRRGRGGVTVPPTTSNGPPPDILGTLTRLIDTLAAVPDRRKIVFLIGDGSDLRDSSSPARDRLYRAADRANVNLYCLDADGLVAPFRITNDPKSVDPHGPSRNVLVEMADNTGGEAVVNTNDVAGAVPGIFRENQSYYLLGFEPVRPSRDGSLRRVDVKVNRPDVDVRARRGYYASAPGASATSTTRTAAEAKPFDGPLPARGLPLRIAVAALAGTTRATSTVAIALDVSEPGVAWSKNETLQVDIRSFSAEGREERTQSQTIRWAPQAATAGDREGTVLTRMDLPPGYHELRVAIRSAAMNRTGSVFADVDVPDFVKDPLSLSGVIVHAETGTPTVGNAALAGFIAAIPSTRREFVTTDRVSTSLSIYQGAKGALSPVTLSTTIVNDRDQPVYTASKTLSIDRFSAAERRAESSFDLPLDHLPRGAYLLTFEAAMGTQRAQRDVQFSVK